MLVHKIEIDNPRKKFNFASYLANINIIREYNNRIFCFCKYVFIQKLREVLFLFVY